MGVHWKDTSFIIEALSVFVLCTASSNKQSCDLNNVQFLFDMIGLRKVVAYSNVPINNYLT